ncbi:SRPBCC family protein [Paenibacillus sp. TRM 82003]|uniref:SRPBCC family protein n=1 Tax=Kineococcus sp. TRM81007 TaxID=2925831 RepID=UPI001F57CC63|nr:SRPBCC family protein [Kineococcus sp. TRM81007]MCI2239797.1 SRPBCC family protein [Kineococcus sp. TRM81007]MCI3925900.1 SRPBCC family protein [Paenibacillus sp. TRM 82003]
MPEIVQRTMVRGTVDEVFDVSLDLDVERVAGRRFRVRAVEGAGRTKGRIELGERVRWRLRLFGLVPVTHTSNIVELERPRRFVDRMDDGLFAEFHHEHVFEPEGPGMTIVTDRMAWRSPAGLLGRVADVLFVRRTLRRLLADRNSEIVRRFS